MHMKKSARLRLTIAFVAMAAMMFAMVPAGPASATPGLAAVQGTARLNGGVGTCSTGSFSGSAVGIHGTAPSVLTGVSASYSYCDELIVVGTASGTLSVVGITCGFDWTRVGVTAVVVFRAPCTGAAAAGFAPTTLPGSVPATAVVAGVGAIAAH
jgi:hypothetical protein